jgi:predicted membrane chloride channel (bestrophin family)
MPLQAMLPFGLWEQDNWVLLMPFLFLSILMLGVDEVACQLENPWPLIPMRAYLKSTLQDTKR